MLFSPGLSSFLWTYSNETANPSSTPGASITPGASNAEGSWAQIATSGNIASNVHWIYLNVNGGSTSASSKPQLLDLGVDAAGGSSYTAIVSDLVCGGAPVAAGGTGSGQHFFFPLFIPAGSSVAVRFQGANATAGTVRLLAKFYGQPSRPDVMASGQFSETIGTITSSNGVSFTPGNAADGTWASLGTTTNALWWWQLGYQIDNTSTTSEATYIDLAFGDGSNKHIIKRLQHIGSSTESAASARMSNLIFPECYCPVPAGTNLYVRGRCSDAPDTGYNAVAIGFG